MKPLEELFHAIRAGRISAREFLEEMQEREKAIREDTIRYWEASQKVKKASVENQQNP